MKELMENFVKVEKTLSEKKGPFRLFALFLRSDAPGVWDLVVSAPWADGSRTEVLNSIASEMKSQLPPQLVNLVSRIVVVGASSEVVETVTRFCRVEHNLFQLMDLTLGRIPIKHAIIITAVAPETPGETAASPSTHTQG